MCADEVPPPVGLTESQFREYLAMTKLLPAMGRGARGQPFFLLKANEVGRGRSRGVFIFKVARTECPLLLELVILPLFTESRQLHLVEYNRNALDLLHRGLQPPVNEGGAGPSEVMYWIEKPGCVKFWDKKKGPDLKGKAARELLTCCVFTGARSKIDYSGAQREGTRDRAVQHSMQAQGYTKLVFWLRASKERQAGEDGSWVPCQDMQEGWFRVEMLLHQLIFYLKEGFQDPSMCPFDVGPFDQRRLVMHLCEQPRCCCPWHLHLGRKAENMLRALAQPPHKRCATWGTFQSSGYGLPG
jgi:hypothetical protein